MEVIGSMEDLTNATLKDVHEFHQKWYRPNNCYSGCWPEISMKQQTKAWIEKYFGEIEAGTDLGDPKPQPVTLDRNQNGVS